MELGGIIAGLVGCRADRRVPRCGEDEDKPADSRDEEPTGRRRVKGRASLSIRMGTRMKTSVRPDMR